MGVPFKAGSAVFKCVEDTEEEVSGGCVNSGMIYSYMSCCPGRNKIPMGKGMYKCMAETEEELSGIAGGQGVRCGRRMKWSRFRNKCVPAFTEEEVSGRW